MTKAAASSPLEDLDHPAAVVALGRAGGAGGEGKAAVPRLDETRLPAAALAPVPGGRQPRQGAVQQGPATAGGNAARGAVRGPPGASRGAGRVRQPVRN